MANAPGHGIRPSITADELAAILRRSKHTILSDLNRADWRVPPPCTPSGTRRPLWRPETVEAWLQAASAQPPRRPKKKRGSGAADAASTSQIAAQVAAELPEPSKAARPTDQRGATAADRRFQSLLEEQADELEASAREQGARTPPPGEPPQAGAEP